MYYIIYVSCRQNRLVYQELISGDALNLAASNFVASKPTKIFAHGWMGNGYNYGPVLSIRDGRSKILYKTIAKTVVANNATDLLMQNFWRMRIAISLQSTGNNSPTTLIIMFQLLILYQLAFSLANLLISWFPEEHLTAAFTSSALVWVLTLLGMLALKRLELSLASRVSKNTNCCN